MKTPFFLLMSTILLAIQDTQGYDGIATKSFEKRDIKKWLIYSGTKWCGSGNIAKSYNDLGKHRAADMCCRAHDKKCSIRIKSFGKKYNTWNLSWKVKSHCSCEKAFKQCLEKANTKASQSLFAIYFNVIKPDCIKLKWVKYQKCVKRRWGFCVKHKTAYKKKAFYYDLHKELNIN